MGAASDLRSRFRRIVRLTVIVAGVLALLAPLWLGPAIVPLTQAISAKTHVCACGMAPGTCGCPECALQEQAWHRDHTARAYPVLKSSCDNDSPTLPAFALSACVLSATVTVRQSARISTPVQRLAPRLYSAENTPPPTPPPRGALRRTA